MKRILATLTALVLAVTLPAGAAPATIAAPLRITTLGDSLTIGVGSSDGQGYRHRLGQLLDAAGLPYVWTSPDTSAHAGWTVQDIAAGVDGWLAADRPDLVILAIGTNNAAGVAPGMASYQSTYSALVARILADAPAARVMLVQVSYSNAGWSPAEVLVNQYVIQASWTSSRLILASWAGVATCTLADGVHPRADGYGVMADQLYRAMAPVYGLPAIPSDAVPANPVRPGYDAGRTGAQVVMPCGSGYPG